MKSNKIFITGAGGFIGSNLCERCIELGYQVKAFVHYNSRNSLGWLENSKFKNEIDFVSGDIRDFDLIYKSLKECYTVFHLAALIGIPYSYVSPLAYIKTNIEGTYNILEAAKERQLENIIITSTSETYGTAQYVPIDEKHPLIGQSPYSATKIAADQLAISYFRSFELPVKIVRPFNTYGPRQSTRAIIPTIISQLIEDKKLINIGNPTPTRDFTYVKDTVNGFIEIFKSNNLEGEITNIGMGKEISVKDLALLISRLMKKEIIINSDKKRIRPENSEVERLCCNNNKLIKNTKWEPMYNLEKGLSETIDWFQNNMDFYNPNLYHI